MGLIHDNLRDAFTKFANNCGINVYPVGSIYMSFDSTSPAGIFGGVWERIKDKFLMPAGDIYVANSTGGSAE